MSHEPEIDARTAAAIAAGMRAVALADGEVHPRELAMIEEFAAAVPADVDPSHVRIDDPAVLDVLVRSLLMVALADGRVSDVEREVVLEIARAHGGTPALVARVEEEVRRVLLGQFVGVRLFADEALAVGRELGLDDEESRRILTREA